MNPIKHVAIIMDGNGRWGIKNKQSRNMGHKAGLVTAEKIIKETVKNKIKFVTLYAFSTENWKSPNREVKFLFNLLEEFLITKTKQLNNQYLKSLSSFKKSSNKYLSLLSQINIAMAFSYSMKRMYLKMGSSLISTHAL